MTVVFTTEQDELRGTVRRFVQDATPLPRVRKQAEGAGPDDELWNLASAQLGLPGIGIPEDCGGSGGDLVEIGVVLEELGYGLALAPYFSTAVLGARVLLLAGDGPGSRWLPDVAAGDVRVTLALAEDSVGPLPDRPATVAEESGDGWSLSGTKMFVPDGADADLIIVVATTSSGPGLFLVTGDAVGVTRRELSTIDKTRRLARIELTRTPAEALLVGDRAGSVLASVVDGALVALAAEQVGGAQACLDMAVEYAKIRVQFGRPIGSFQAIKHLCADILVLVESARSTLYHALDVAVRADPDLPGMAIATAVASAHAFTEAAKANIQVHGGIGFTWEHDAHLFLKRAKSSEHLLGSPAHHRDRLATLLIGAPA